MNDRIFLLYGCAATPVAMRARRLKGFSGNGKNFRIGELLIRPGRMVSMRLSVLRKNKSRILHGVKSSVLEVREGSRRLSLEELVLLLDGTETLEVTTATAVTTEGTEPSDEDAGETAASNEDEATESGGAEETVEVGGGEEDATDDPSEPTSEVPAEEPTNETPTEDPPADPPAAPSVPEDPPAAVTLPANWEKLNKAGLEELASKLGIAVEESDTKKTISEKIRAHV